MSLIAIPPAAPAGATRPLDLQVFQLRQAALVIRAINHPLRQQMMQLLYRNGFLTVTELFTKMNLEQSVASQHLALLRRAGFVNTLREGKYIHYSVNEERLGQVQKYCSNLLHIPAPR